MVKITEQWKCNYELLAMLAEATVPMLIHDLEKRGGLRDHHIEWLNAQVDVLASGGDALMCNLALSGKRGQTADKAAILFKCLSYMAFFPGGVEFMGKRYIGQTYDNRG